MITNLDVFAAILRTNFEGTVLCCRIGSGNMLCFPGAVIDFTSTVWNGPWPAVAATGRAVAVISGQRRPVEKLELVVTSDDPEMAF